MSFAKSYLNDILAELPLDIQSSITGSLTEHVYVWILDNENLSNAFISFLQENGFYNILKTQQNLLYTITAQIGFQTILAPPSTEMSKLKGIARANGDTSSSSSSQLTVVSNPSQVTSNSSVITPADNTYTEITLLTCNDVYNITDLSKWLNLANNFEKNNTDSNTIRILAGDFISPNKNSAIIYGMDMINASNISKFDVIGLGNHEFDFGLEKLKTYSNISIGKFICSNIPKSLCDEINVLYNYSIQIENLKVGFISYLTNTTPVLSIGATNIEFDNVNTMFIKQKEFLLNNDLNILLFHGDLDEITNYFSDNNNNEYKTLIDAVVLGHEHNSYSSYIERVDKPSIPFVEVALDSASNFGLGIIKLKYNNSTRKLYSSSVNTVYGKEESPELQELNTLISSIVAPFFKETIGVITDFPLNGLKASIRNNETNMGDLIVDSFLNVAKKLLVNKIPLENIFGIVNSGSIRNDSTIPIGTSFTTEIIYTTLPFTNEIVFLKINGKANLLYLINYLGSISFNRKDSGGWLQITNNLKFNYTTKQYQLLGYNNSIEEYYLVLNDYLAEGNDGYSELKNYDKFESDIPSQNAVREYVKDTLNGIISISNIYTRIIV